MRHPIKKLSLPNLLKEILNNFAGKHIGVVTNYN
jgi:hypothetical protein